MLRGVGASKILRAKAGVVVMMITLRGQKEHDDDYSQMPEGAWGSLFSDVLEEVVAFVAVPLLLVRGEVLVTDDDGERDELFLIILGHVEDPLRNLVIGELGGLFGGLIGNTAAADHRDDGKYDPK
jgi:hypothetical protein